MPNEKTSTQRITRSRFLDRGAGIYGSVRSIARNMFDFADKSMNDKRVFMMMLLLVAGYMIFTFYNNDCGHDKKIHKIISA